MVDKDYMDQLVAAGPPPEQSVPPTSKLTTISAAALQQKDIPPLQFVIDDLIPYGLTLLCSPPKYGKSWMALDLGLQVAQGKPFLQCSSHQCGCLYLALEDGERRLKYRMEKLLKDESAPANFHFATNATTLKTGLCEMLDDFLQTHSGIGLIIIDTFQFVRDCAPKKEAPYATDYREVSTLKRFADKHNIALLLVHHLNKRVDDGDPYNMVSGTTGITGAADTIMVMTRAKRSDTNTNLSFISRDVEERETVLTFNKDTYHWTVVGSAQDIAAQQSRRTYETNPTVRTIKALLARNPEGWCGTMSELLEAGQKVTGSPLASGPRDLAAKLRVLDDLLLADSIDHTRIPHGTGGGKHQFRRILSAEEILNSPLPEIPF